MRPSSSGAPSAVTVIAQGVKLEGEFASQGDVVVDGEVHGTLSAGGKLTVGAEAKIIADVSVGEAVIAGMVQGNVVVSRRLELKSTARITGDLSAESLSVEAGAVLSGRVVSGSKASQESARPKSPGATRTTGA